MHCGQILCCLSHQGSPYENTDTSICFHNLNGCSYAAIKAEFNSCGRDCMAHKCLLSGPLHKNFAHLALGVRRECNRVWVVVWVFRVLGIAIVSSFRNYPRNQPWLLIGRTDAEAEAPVLWPLDATSQLTEIEGRRRSGRQRMRCLDSITDSMRMN